MKFTNNHNLPKPLANALAGDHYSRGNSRKSVTQLIGSPQIDILAREHAHEIEVDVMDRVWSVFGTAVHKIIEDGSAGMLGYTSEERLYDEVEGWIISGGVDLQQFIQAGAYSEWGVTDWKTTSAWAVINEKPEWERQLNFYAWLVERTKPGARVIRLSIGAIIRDWNRRSAQEQRDYPQTPIVMIPITLWPWEKRDAYVKERVRIHQDAERAYEWGDPLPECTPEDMWEKDSTWAVKKPGNKRASKVFDNPEDAAHMAKEIGGAVEHRAGERVRCDNYCPAARWCSQYRTYLEDKNETY